MAGRDFASNDYLGLASHPRLAAAIAHAIEQGVPVGSGGSRLLRGNHPEHEALEAEAAAFFGAEASLYFSSGYTANATLLATLPQRGDLIVHDALVHASMHEGMKLSRATPRRRSTTIRPRSRRRSGLGVSRAARAPRGSRSKASIRWTATPRP